MGDAPERIWAWSTDTIDRDNYPLLDTGWESDDFNRRWFAERDITLTEYLRADIAAAREADLRADVERVTRERDEWKSDLHALQRAIVDDTSASAILEAEKLHAEVERLNEEALVQSELHIAAIGEAARLRALLDEALPVIEEAAAVAHKAFVAANMEAVNAGPMHPLKRQLDAWRVRCMNVEQRARAILAKIGGQHD